MQNNLHNPDKQVHRRDSNTNHVNEVAIQTHSLTGTKLETKMHLTTLTMTVLIVVFVLHQTPNDYHGLIKLLRLPLVT